MLHLVFSHGNAKLDKLEKIVGKEVWSFSTLAGWNCPYAKECESRVTYNGKGFTIKDGPHTKFRCFSASQEVIFPAVRESRLNNSQLVELCAIDVNKAIEAVLYQLPKYPIVMRLHVSGDFKTQAYFDMWCSVAQYRPDIKFYAYTKSLPFWVKRINSTVWPIPKNFQLTASFGGYRDDLISTHNLRSATVVYSVAEAKALGLSIDYTDELAYNDGPSFALLLHGIQPKGSDAAAALQLLKVVKN